MKIYFVTGIHLYFVLLVLVSCSTVEKSRFDEFYKKIEQLNESSRETFSQVEKESRTAGVKKLALGKEVKPSELRVSVRGFEWEMDNPPAYLKLKKAKIHLNNLNDLLLSYSEIIGQIAGSEITTPQSFNKLAKDLNTNAMKLHETISGDKDAKSIGLMSSAAISALESYINNKSYKLLSKAIKENQHYIESHIQLMIELIGLMKELIVKSYSDNFTGLSINWVKSQDRTGTSNEIFDLNDDLLMDLEKISILRSNFLELPALHQALVKNEEDGFSFRVKGIERSLKRFQEIQKAQKE